MTAPTEKRRRPLGLQAGPPWSCECPECSEWIAKTQAKAANAPAHALNSDMADLVEQINDVSWSDSSSF